MHICRHCVFYKPGVFRDCTETIPEAVKDKDRMNFCDYFKADPKTVKNSSGIDASNAAKDAFNDIFSG